MRATMLQLLQYKEGEQLQGHPSHDQDVHAIPCYPRFDVVCSNLDDQCRPHHGCRSLMNNEDTVVPAASLVTHGCPDALGRIRTPAGAKQSKGLAP